MSRDEVAHCAADLRLNLLVGTIEAGMDESTSNTWVANTCTVDVSDPVVQIGAISSSERKHYLIPR